MRIGRPGDWWPHIARFICRFGHGSVPDARRPAICRSRRGGDADRDEFCYDGGFPEPARVMMLQGADWSCCRRIGRRVRSVWRVCGQHAGDGEQCRLFGVQSGRQRTGLSVHRPIEDLRSQRPHAGRTAARPRRDLYAEIDVEKRDERRSFACRSCTRLTVARSPAGDVWADCGPFKDDRGFYSRPPLSSSRVCTGRHAGR